MYISVNLIYFVFLHLTPYSGGQTTTQTWRAAAEHQGDTSGVKNSQYPPSPRREEVEEWAHTPTGVGGEWPLIRTDKTIAVAMFNTTRPNVLK